MLIAIAIVLLIGLVYLKHKFDPNNDAFRTKERKGWHFAKANVISLDEYRNRRQENENGRN